MNQNIVKIIFIFLSSMILSVSCSKDSGGGGGGGIGGKTGCIQGVLIDAISGKRIPVPSASATQGVYVVVNNHKVAGSGMTNATESDGIFVGEYSVCGVPVENQYPLTVKLDGYQSFFGTISDIRSTAGNRTASANGITKDIDRNNATELHNIRLYPTGAKAVPLVVTVSGNGKPLADTTVNLEPQGSGVIAANSGSFMSPSLERFEPLTGVTDAEGKVTFEAEKLVLGGMYSYTAIPSDPASFNVTTGTGIFAGASTSNSGNDLPTDVSINMTPALPTGSLYVVSTSNATRNYDPSGTMSITLSREMEYVPDTEDNVVAVLAGNVSAALVSDEADNDAPDQVTVTMVGKTITLTPIFDSEPVQEDDLEMTITYSGISIRPKNSNGNTDVLTLPSYTVSFYK